MSGACCACWQSARVCSKAVHVHNRMYMCIVGCTVVIEHVNPPEEATPLRLCRAVRAESQQACASHVARRATCRSRKSLAASGAALQADTAKPFGNVQALRMFGRVSADLEVRAIVTTDAIMS
jgi:hypothetical protein